MPHRIFEDLPSKIYALGFSWRKRPLVRRFFGSIEVRFGSLPSSIPDGATVAVWASGEYGVRSIHNNAMQRFERLFIEDGFLRSVGLGADLVRPLSWAIDRRGIYFDSLRPSDLEHLLQTASVDEEALHIASLFRKALVSTGLTKYNVGTRQWKRPLQAKQKEVVLVPGQVETDASIRFGAPGISTNLALLRSAREAHPDAWLIYKPHPDVVAKLRAMGVQEDLAWKWCDQILTDVSMGSLLQDVDVVHVLTSLTGFEALLREKKVICHGLPFYAGWGLTNDICPIPRRSRKLTIDHLVAVALRDYPVYLSRAAGKLCPPEQALADLLKWREKSSDELPFWRRLIRPVLSHA